MAKTIDEIQRDLAKKPLERSILIDRAAVDEANRTVSLAFASDKPVEHWFGKLSLSMKPGAMRTDRLTSGAPLLMDHNSRDQIGVVEDYSVDQKDGMARAIVRFSDSARGEEIFRDVKNGIRRNVSVGFLVNGLELIEEKKGELPSYRCDDWEPMEVSIVSMPADTSVGVGRSLNLERDDATDAETCPDCEEPMDVCDCADMGDETKNSATSRSQREKTIRSEKTKMKDENTQTPGSPVNTVERSAELVLADEIREWGRNFDCPEVATAYLRENAGGSLSKEAFFARVKASQAPVVATPVAAVAEEAQRQGAPKVELARTMPRYAVLRNFTGERAAERAHRFGMWLLAGPFGGSQRAAQFCKENGILVRTQQESVNEKGGFLVPEEFGNDLIDLREQYGVFRRNAKVVPMASETRSDPRRTGGLTAYFAAESAALTASDKTWDRVELVAKKLTAYARFSTEITEDAVINIADDLAGEIAYAFANKEDDCGFNGDGTDTYGGIVGFTQKFLGLSGTIANIAGLQVATGTGYGSSYASAVLADFEAVAAKLPVYADTGRAKWFCHKSFYWNVMVKLALAAGGNAASDISGGVAKRFLGYDVEFVQILPSTSAVSQVCALLGDLSLAASFGSRRDTMIALSEHSRFANDEIEIRGTERFDINVHDVGNASATANLRVPGPVVGLITAAS